MEQKTPGSIPVQQSSSACEYRSVTMGLARVLETGELVPNISYKVEPDLSGVVASALCELHTRCWLATCGLPSPLVGDEASTPPLWLCNEVLDELLVEHNALPVLTPQETHVHVGAGFAVQRYFATDDDFIAAVLRSRSLARRIVSYAVRETVGTDAEELSARDFTEQRKNNLVRCVAHFFSLTGFLDIPAPLTVYPPAHNIMISMVKPVADFTRILGYHGVKDQRTLLDFMESLDYRFASYSSICPLDNLLGDILSETPHIAHNPNALQSTAILLTAVSNCGRLHDISPALKSFLALFEEHLGSNDKNVVSRAVRVLDAICSSVVSGHYTEESLTSIIEAMVDEPRILTDAPCESFDILVSNLSQSIPEEVSAISALSSVETPEQALTVLGHIYGLSAYLNTPDYCFDVVAALVDVGCNTVFIEQSMAVNNNDITLLPHHPSIFGLLMSLAGSYRVKNPPPIAFRDFHVGFDCDMFRSHLSESSALRETDGNTDVFELELNIRETISAMHNEGFDLDGFEDDLHSTEVLVACDIYGLDDFLCWKRDDVDDVPWRDARTSHEAIAKRLRNYSVDNSLKERVYDDAAVFTRPDGSTLLCNDYGVWHEASAYYATSVLRGANVVAFDALCDEGITFTALMSYPYRTERTAHI